MSEVDFGNEKDSKNGDAVEESPTGAYMPPPPRLQSPAYKAAMRVIQQMEKKAKTSKLDLTVKAAPVRGRNRIQRK
jgi:hypothetical protein